MKQLFYQKIILQIFILIFFVFQVSAQAVINPSAVDDDVEIGIVEHLDDFFPTAFR